ncbi:WSC domain-containing protein [Lactarius indigo]|nr:WSC domain-containing protein [Lactarius indigo]
MHLILSSSFLPAVLQLAILLVIVPIISTRPLETRDPQLPPGWTKVGCVTDNDQIPTLTSWEVYEPTDMTVELCVGHCIDNGLIYAGVEGGAYCYCGNVLSDIAMNATDSDCDIPCVGDPTEMCGGGLRLDLYWSGAPPWPPPVMVPTSSSGPWDLLGCFNDSSDQKVLSYTPVVEGGKPGFTSVESCTLACYMHGFVLAGVEMADQCFCDDYFSNLSMMMPADECDLPCSANQSEICGGEDRMVVYVCTGPPSAVY